LVVIFYKCGKFFVCVSEEVVEYPKDNFSLLSETLTAKKALQSSATGLNEAKQYKNTNSTANHHGRYR